MPTTLELTLENETRLESPPIPGWYWFRHCNSTNWHIVRILGHEKNPTVRDTWGVRMNWKDWPTGYWEAIEDRNLADYSQF